MKLRLNFGRAGINKIMNWNDTIQSFPNLVRFQGKKWEFIAYDKDDTLQAEYILMFGELESYDPNWHAGTYADLDYLLGKDSNLECQCGKDKHNFTSHSSWCDKAAK